jgi:hypothetical protein
LWLRISSLYVSIQAFGEDFLVDKLKPFLKSDPIPESVSHSICDVYPACHFLHL